MSRDPYFGVEGFETVMQRQRSLAAMLALGILLVTPMAWGCQGTGMQNCSMSDCPMTDQRAAEGCHESRASSGHRSSGCDATPTVWIACCGTSARPESARIDSVTSWDHDVLPLTVPAERVQLEPPAAPPDLILEAISSQQHELGRFTLLSSFLL